MPALASKPQLDLEFPPIRQNFTFLINLTYLFRFQLVKQVFVFLRKQDYPLFLIHQKTSCARDMICIYHVPLRVRASHLLAHSRGSLAFVLN